MPDPRVRVPWLCLELGVGVVRWLGALGVRLQLVGFKARGFWFFEEVSMLLVATILTAGSSSSGTGSGFRG